MTISEVKRLKIGDLVMLCSGGISTNAIFGLVIDADASTVAYDSGYLRQVPAKTLIWISGGDLTVRSYSLTDSVLLQCERVHMLRWPQ